MFLENIFGKIFESVTNKVLDIVDEKIEDVDLKNKLKAEIQKELINLQSQYLELIKYQLDTYKEIVKSELSSDSWLAKNWRPIVAIMLALVWFYSISPIPVLIAHYYNIDPKLLMLSQEDKSTVLYLLSGAFMVSYGIGRTIEKISKLKKL
jgi:hypothetical protein